MPAQRVEHLRDAFDFRLSELVGLDLLAGAAGGAAGACAGYFAPGSLAAGAGAAATLVGVTIGATVAGVALLGSFLDQEFLRKLRLIDADPVRPMTPFLFTAALGVVAALLLLCLAFLPGTAPRPVLPVAAGLAGFASFWCLASLIPALDTLVQFVRLRDDAASLPDHVVAVPQEAPRPARAAETRRQRP